MKNTIHLVLFLFLSKSSFGIEIPLASTSYDMCGQASCGTSNGIAVSNFPYAPNMITTVHISSIDSMSVFLHAGGDCSIGVNVITIDSVPVSWTHMYTGFSATGVKLLALPGTYIVNAKIGFNFTVWFRFTLVLDPVGISKYSTESETGITIFPNPTTREINVISKSVGIRQIQLYNSTGQELENITVEGHKIQIPLNDYLSGIYFIHVATLSDKIIIKKITVL